MVRQFQELREVLSLIGLPMALINRVVKERKQHLLMEGINKVTRWTSGVHLKQVINQQQLHNMPPPVTYQTLLPVSDLMLELTTKFTLATSIQMWQT